MARSSEARVRGALLALPLLLGAACGDGAETARRPPVILVVLDALAAGHVGHLGYERDTTPVLDALAESGATFTNAIAPAPYTQASISSLLTGQWPATHGVHRTGDSVSESTTTLAEALAANGYRTFAAVATMNGSSMIGVTQGFESFEELFRPEGQRQRVRRDRTALSAPSATAMRKQRDALRIVRAEDYLPVLEGWIAALKPVDVPFFYLHVLEPHSPYQPPEPFRSRFVDPAYDGPFAEGDNKTLVGSTRGEIVADDADIAATRALYDANLAYGDHVLGRMFDLLREAGLYDDAFVIVTSDHGEAFWQHGIWGHNEHVYEDMVRVPLVVKFPAGEGPAGVRADALVSSVDVVPSLLAWLDLPAPGGLDGVPLDPQRPADAERLVFLRSNHEEPIYGLRTPSHKLVVRGLAGGSPELELFDLEADPHEERPLTVGPEAERLFETLRERMRALRQARRAPEGEKRELTAEEREHLEALGYTE